MNVLLVSQCDKRALTETRRILDQFAERRGDRTWQTPITEAGLDTLRRLLRKTARKNTAVACHWIRGLDRSELLWIVGDARRFNGDGAVPTNTTTRNVLRRQDENDWHTAEDIQLLTQLAGLLHDLGKACRAFQRKLHGDASERNLYRHEWISLRLFQAFVGRDTDEAWLERLCTPTADDDATWTARLVRDGLDADASPPFAALAHAPLAQAIGWLVVTHHRLPLLPSEETFTPTWLKNTLQRVDARWNDEAPRGDTDAIRPYWLFDQLPATTPLWKQRAARIARRLRQLMASPDHGNWLANPFVMHLSRLSLMLADHYYSSLSGSHADRIRGAEGYPLWANTCVTGAGERVLNQPLDEHLLGVASHGAAITSHLPDFADHLPRLGRHRKLRQRSREERFRWQDRAADMATGISRRSAEQGAFIVNMASTGCGKTLANARVMYSLADPAKGMRCAFAMGLRTLTLQTGRAFQQLLGLSADELAIRVGGGATLRLFEHYERLAEATGSASSQQLMHEEEGSVQYVEGNEKDHPLLRRLADPQIMRLVAAPLLVCTIDHLTPATESQRGGRQIGPMLRLMSGDLVLDEPDDFDIDDLPALTRLVHWAGLLGARVLLSSATLPPALVRGLFDAYREGRRHHHRNRSSRPASGPAVPPVCCAWVDEFGVSQVDCADSDAFSTAHASFVGQRSRALITKAAPVRRRASIVNLPLAGLHGTALHEGFARAVLDSAATLHERHHTADPHSGKRISFGLVRMANIEPIYEVALALYRLGAPAGLRIHLCVYHSQYPLLLRSAIEHQLDAALNRREPTAVFDLPDIRQRIDHFAEVDQLFVVLASAVSEVGRDHDYDWAVVEPSSMRSLIQLAGRVKRHRDEACLAPNIHVFQTNLRALQQPGQPAFCRPGFESADWPLDSHDLHQLLEGIDLGALDARPRIQCPEASALKPRQRLIDLEHARLLQTMQGRSVSQPAQGARKGPWGRAAAPQPAASAASWWQLPAQDALLTGLLPQRQPFRRQTQPTVEVLLRPNEDRDGYELALIPETHAKGQPAYVSAPHLLHAVPPQQVAGARIAPWAADDYLIELNALAEGTGLAPGACAERFGTASLPASDDGWRFHPALGFAKYRR